MFSFSPCPISTADRNWYCARIRSTRSESEELPRGSPRPSTQGSSFLCCLSLFLMHSGSYSPVTALADQLFLKTSCYFRLYVIFTTMSMLFCCFDIIARCPENAKLMRFQGVLTGCINRCDPIGEPVSSFRCKGGPLRSRKQSEKVCTTRSGNDFIS